MAVRARDLPAILFGRIAQSHPAPAQFARGETDEWPDGTLAALLEAGIVYHANRADVVICPGCEWQCHKAVSVRTSAAHGVRATIMCDEEPRHGRIPVALSLLDRVATSLRTLAELIARELELDTPSPSASGSFYSLGEIKGRLGRRPVRLGIEEGEVQLIVGSQRVPLTRAIVWSGKTIEIDRRLVTRLADRKGKLGSRSSGYQPDRSRQRQRTRARQARDRAIYREARRLREDESSWTAVSKLIAASPLAAGLSWSRVRRIISAEQKREREFSRANREERN